MNRQEKKHIIDSLKEDFSQSSASFLVGYKGVDVSKMMNLRKELKKQGGNVKVAKVTLMRRAMNDIAGSDTFDSVFKDQVALIFAQKESPAIAKILCKFAKEHENLRILAGFLDSRLLQAGDIKALASLPPREVLLAQLCGTLQAPATQLASVLNMLVIRLLWALKKIEEKKAAQPS